MSVFHILISIKLVYYLIKCAKSVLEDLYRVLGEDYFGVNSVLKVFYKTFIGLKERDYFGVNSALIGLYRV